MLDDLDSKILRLLERNGRISWSELGQSLQMSATSAAERVKRLEQKGIISGYTAQINYKAIAPYIMAFITVTLDRPAVRFDQAIHQVSQILECYHIAGEGSYLLKTRCADIDELEKLVNYTIKEIPGVLKTVTTVVLSATKGEGYVRKM